jgi:uncharacterized membrane protein YjgN (DUF898 family)
MALVTLACPHCGFFKEVDAALLPPQARTATCPKCRGQFNLEFDAPPAESEELATADCEALAPTDCGTASPEQEDWLGPGPALALPADVPPLQAAPRTQARRTLTFSFTGNAKEYFGIWIVNTLLRIVTFGIYSPWAKVRKRRYFYCNTLLDDATFDYLADPLAILKGWFIAGVFFGLYSLASRTSPIASFALMLVFLGVCPWVIVRSRMFSLRNSSHRNIRFSFSPNYGDAYKVYLWWSLLTPFTLGLLAPYLVYRQKRFLVENSCYGTTPFQFQATAKQYYRVFLPVLVLVLLGLGAAGWIYLASQGGGNNALMALPILLLTVIYLAMMLYLPIALTNLTWNSTSIGRHRFASTLRVRDLAWIYLSSAVAVLCSFGLLAPWAAVRLARYRLDQLALSGVGELDSIYATQQEAPGATGEELGDMLGFDLGL